MRQDGLQRFQPEVEFLLCCVQEQALDSPVTSSSTFEHSKLDWKRVIDLARRHRLEPFIYQSAIEDGFSIPSDVRTDLETASEALTHRNLYMVSELASLLDRFEEAGVRALTYKGPSLAELAYHDVTLREFVDLDILVPEEDFQKAVDLLCADNYIVEESYPAFGETTLREQDAGIPVDLHFRVTPARYPFTFSFDRLWARRVDVSLCGRIVQTFCLSDLLPVIAVHGTRHFWVQLEWLASFAALTQYEPIHWQRVIRRSKQVGCDRMVMLGLQLAQELFGLSLPEKASTAVEEDWLVRRLSKRVVSRVVREDVDHSQENRLFHYERYLVQLLLMRGVQARGKYGIRIGRSLASNRLNH